MTEVMYCTREAVKSALDSKATSRDNARVDQAIAGSSRATDKLCNRPNGFAPMLITRTYERPTWQRSDPGTLFLDATPLISVSSVVVDGVALDLADVRLRPESGPPYTRLELDPNSSAAWGAENVVTGLGGVRNDTRPAGALAAAVSTTTATTIAVTDSATLGVGSVLLVDSERMLVTGRAMVTTGQTVQTPLTAQANAVTVAVTTGTAYTVGEVILLDAEKMLIDDIAGNTLIVRRGWDGSVLAAHTGSTIYAPRTLIVERGALGTTAATHSNAAPITEWQAPSLVRQLVLAESLNEVLQAGAGYARTAGSGENERELSGKGINSLRAQVEAAYGRHARMRSV